VTPTEQFIASLVHSLAWPAAVAALAFGFRGQLARLLDRPLRRLRAGPVDMEWERVMARTEAKVETATPVAAALEATAGSGIKAELAQFAREAPVAAILEAFSRVESRLRDMLRATGVESSAGNVELAREALSHGVISAKTFSAVEGVAVMRNLATHNRIPGRSVDEALEYLDLIDVVLYTLRRSDSEGRES
jgi:hypothetical protein